jgi:acyl carrier protein
MEREDIAKALRSLMSRSSEIEVDWDQISETDTIESLGFDSLSILDLIYDIQSEFNTDFEAEAMAGIRTVGDLLDFLSSRLG